jgi:hypothetical protein
MSLAVVVQWIASPLVVVVVVFPPVFVPHRRVHRRLVCALDFLSFLRDYGLAIFLHCTDFNTSVPVRTIPVSFVLTFSSCLIHYRGCRFFKPKYVAMAETLLSKYDDVEVYAVSCGPHKDICAKYQVTGYPVRSLGENCVL